MPNRRLWQTGTGWSRGGSKNESQRLSSIQFIIRVSFSQILAFISQLSKFFFFFCFNGCQIPVRVRFCPKNSVVPKYDPISNMLKTLWMIGKFQQQMHLEGFGQNEMDCIIFTCLCFQNHISIIIALFSPCNQHIRPHTSYFMFFRFNQEMGGRFVYFHFNCNSLTLRSFP